MRIVELNEQNKKDLLKNLLKRSTSNYGDFEAKVADIVENVRVNGDSAVFEYTSKFDGVTVTADT